MQSNIFEYNNTITWIKDKQIRLSAPNKPDLKVGTPPEFGGQVGLWTPEDLFVASVNICIQTTFLHFADKTKLSFVSYNSKAIGTLEKSDKKLMFTVIKVSPKIKVLHFDDIIKTVKLLDRAERYCLISNSVKSKIEINENVEVTDENSNLN